MGKTLFSFNPARGEKGFQFQSELISFLPHHITLQVERFAVQKNRPEFDGIGIFFKSGFIQQPKTVSGDIDDLKLLALDFQYWPIACLINNSEILPSLSFGNTFLFFFHIGLSHIGDYQPVVFPSK